MRVAQIRVNIESALCGVSGEVLTRIGLRLKQESPFSETMMLTHANGSSGYFPDDEAFKEISYETLVTRCKPGVEHIIIKGLLELLGRP